MSGQLIIFTSYAPGTGKSAAMLKYAIESKRRGASVVIGYMNKLDRPYTNALVTELDPEYTQSFDEPGFWGKLDLAKILATHAGVCVVDELMFKNRLSGRYLYADVERLRDHGIDVLGTVSMLRLNPLNDLCARVSGVRAASCLPEAVFLSADKVFFVDVPPEIVAERYKSEGFFRFNGETWRRYTAVDNLSAYRNAALDYLRKQEEGKYEILDGSGA